METEKPPSFFVYAGNEVFLMDRQVTFATSDGISFTLTGDKVFECLKKGIEELTRSGVSLQYSLPPQ